MGINASTIQKLYIAYFNRPADVAGLTYWEGQLDGNKISLAGLAQSFSEQVEYVATYGGKSTADVVTALYKNLFGRAPDAAGLTYWATQIDTRAVNLGTAALAILNGATPDSLDGITIQNKLNFSANFTASLNTVEKANLYSSAYTFELMRGILSGVTATGAPPSLVPSLPLKITEAANGISNAERIAGMDVLVDLKGVQAAAGYTLELMNGNSSFYVPVTHILTAAEVSSQKALIHIPAGINWGPDGAKLLGVKVTDIFGNSGKIGAQTTVVLDTTPPVLPSKATYMTAWFIQPSASLDYGVGEIQFKILPGENAGGTAVLMENGVVIGKVSSIAANADMLDFMIDPKIMKQVYSDVYSNAFGGLSIVLTDAAGNSGTTMLKDYKIKYAGKYKDGTLATNISISTDSKSGTLLVKATINSLEYLNSQAFLKINGQIVASDLNISTADTSVDFNVTAVNSVQIQNLINNGGVVSVVMVDMNGNAIESVNNPVLASNQYGSRAYVDSSLFKPVLPRTGALYGSIDQGLQIREITFPIAPGLHTGGTAAIWEDGKVIAKISNITATSNMLDFVFDTAMSLQVYTDYWTKNNLSLVMTNAAGYSSSISLSTPDMFLTRYDVNGTPATNIVLTPLGVNVEKNTLNSSTTNLLVTATISPGFQYFDSTAYLKINGKIVAKDDVIGISDTTVDFNLGTSDALQLQTLLKSGGVVSVLLVDRNGNFVESVNNPYLTSNFTASSAVDDAHIQLLNVADAAPLLIIGQAPQVANAGLG
ncbi:DUF4214 domain-containing protein [Undibacterium sp. Ji83W]|uniref:DUF4214 domain-containing protein n=1 Tax=Undibacterium sp. Ji83W TaxID=3413043 RepID=UPI003BF0DEDE